MFKYTILFYLLLCILNHVIAQSPASDHSWIGTGRVSARIASAGVQADSTGGFVVKSSTAGKPALNLLSHLAPWIGGLDAAGNLKLACETDDPGKSDWQPGLRDIPGSDKVWKVTRDQIAAHIADFQDNGVIDNPIPAIFAWPARGNAFSLQWNGFEMLYNYVSPAYNDLNNNALYNPEQGEYPVVAIRSPSFNLFPAEIVYAPFFNDGVNTLSLGDPMNINGMLTAFTFECDEQDFAENTVFLAYKFHCDGPEPADSVAYGLYVNFDLGNPQDDYLGSSFPHPEMAYCYNSDTSSDAVAGQNPPIVSIISHRGPLDTFGNEVNLAHVVPILSGDNVLPGMTGPVLPLEFYRYLTGSWRDGSSLTYGGRGYQTGNPTSFAFSGHPSDPGAWSESSAKNPAADRACVMSYEPVSTRPGAINEVVVALTVSERIGPAQQLQQLDTLSHLQWQVLDGFLENSPFDSLCFHAVSVARPEQVSIAAFPNPAHSHLVLRTGESTIHDVTMVEVTGKRVLSRQDIPRDAQEIVLPLNDVPPGIYFLQWTKSDGRRGCSKIVVE